MSISTTLSIWNDGRDRDARREPLDRPLEQRLRLLALELDRELARLQFVDQLDSCSCLRLLPLTRPFAGSRPASYSKLVVGQRGARTP